MVNDGYWGLNQFLDCESGGMAEPYLTSGTKGQMIEGDLVGKDD